MNGKSSNSIAVTCAESFDCGKPSLNDFLHALVTQYERRNLGRTYVALEANRLARDGLLHPRQRGNRSGEACPRTKPRSFRGTPCRWFCSHGWLSIKACTAKAWAAFLLRDAMTRSLDLSEKLGIHAVVVDALDVAAKTFYERFGFVPFVDDEMRLFLPVSTVRSAAGP